MSLENGITFSNVLTESDSINAYKYLYMYNGAGVGIADFNNDGLQDIFFGGNMVSSKLFINQGELKFNDVTLTAGLTTTSWVHGVSIVDINADGYLDIYLSIGGRAIGKHTQNQLYVNNGDLTFTEQSGEYGLNESRLTTYTAFFDFDKDGDLDAYLINYENNPNKDPTAIKRKRPDGNSKSSDRLMRNDNGRFVDVTLLAGIQHEGYGLGLAINDFNNDGWLDVYVSNDFTYDDNLYINDQNGGFQDEIASYVNHTSNFGMGIDMADINNDGSMDLFQVDMLPEDNRRQKKLLSGLNYNRFQLLTKNGYLPQYMRNSVQLGTDNSTFQEVGLLTGMSNTDWSWSPLIADLDNNGFKDVFITNGYVKDVTDVDFRDYIISENQRRSAVFDPNVVVEALRELKGEKVANYAYANEGDLNFFNKAEDWGLAQPSFSTGASYGDLDNDGDLDIVVNNLNHASFVYENRSRELDSLSYLTIDVTIENDHAKAIGTKVNLTVKGEKYSAEVSPFRGFQSTVDARLHFGLNKHTKVDEIEIVWPDKKVTRLEDVKVNQLLSIERETSETEVVIQKPKFQSVFGKASRVSLDYTHKESTFVDFNREPLLPHKLSQEGPCASTADVNGDGLQDIFIGGAAGEPGRLFTQYFRNGALGFKVQELEGNQSEDAGALFIDVDSDGDEDLYVISGSNEFENGSALYADRLYLNDGRGNFIKSEEGINYASFSGGVIVKNDFDNDGDIDLFVGARCKPGEYPLAGTSKFLSNDNGVFNDVTATIAPTIREIGMVKDAVWADLDSDGSNELIITGEFMTIKVFTNIAGSFTDATESYGLSNYVGWWNTLEIVDIDKDGDLDIIGGNLGLNSRYKATNQEPLSIYASDFNGDRRIDPVVAYFNDGKEYILHDRATLSQQINSIKKKFVKNISYAEATIDMVFGQERLDKATKLSANHFKTSLFINHGEEGFMYMELPVEVQYSQVNDIETLDFDKDGILDILFAGNSNSPEVFNGRYDAQSTLLMKGLGNGKFLPLSQTLSGLVNSGIVNKIQKLSVNGEELILLLKNNESPDLLQVRMSDNHLQGGY
ncbi:VCBS repeat-containing protein [Roseivirga sp.]|uniref:VCBS repeat-containing protein n=1 Tax=Roseivirga sp. TaxID=1964215 RepID=UPI003B8B643F